MLKKELIQINPYFDWIIEPIKHWHPNVTLRSDGIMEINVPCNSSFFRIEGMEALEKHLGTKPDNWKQEIEEVNLYYMIDEDKWKKSLRGYKDV
jgi:hypothetical protein